MISNNTQHKSFLWHLDFEPFTWHTFYGEQCPPFVTEENKEAWKRYLKKVIKKHLKAEVMNTSEFRDIELQIREEKLLRIKWGRAEETVYGEATVSCQDGTTENQLYSERAERGL